MRRGTCDPPLVAIYFGDATPLDVPVGGTSVPLVRKRDLLYSVTRCPPFEKEATVLGDLPRLGKRRSREIALVAVCVHPARDFGNALNRATRGKISFPRSSRVYTRFTFVTREDRWWTGKESNPHPSGASRGFSR